MARRTSTDDLRIETKDRIQRMRIETLREQGRYRELVLWMLGYPEPSQPEANGTFETRVVRVPLMPHMEPTPGDLAGALHESGDVPAPIRDWISTRYLLQTKPRKTGDLTHSRTTADDDRVLDFYARAYLQALDAHEANEGPETRAVKTHTRRVTADQFGRGFGVRTIDTILASRQLLN